MTLQGHHPAGFSCFPTSQPVSKFCRSLLVSRSFRSDVAREKLLKRPESHCSGATGGKLQTAFKINLSGCGFLQSYSSEGFLMFPVGGCSRVSRKLSMFQKKHVVLDLELILEAYQFIFSNFRSSTLHCLSI